MRDKVHSPNKVPQLGRLWCLSWLWFGAASEVDRYNLVAVLSTLGLLPRACGYKDTEEVSLYSLASQLLFCSWVATLFWDFSRKSLQRWLRFESGQNARPLQGHACKRCGKFLPYQPFVFSSALVLTLLQESSQCLPGKAMGPWMSKASVSLPFLYFPMFSELLLDPGMC